MLSSRSPLIVVSVRRHITLVVIGHQDIERRSVDVEAKADAVQHHAPNACVPMQARIERSRPIEHLTWRKHPRHRVVRHSIALKTCRGFSRHISNSADRTARCDDDLIVGLILGQWVENANIRRYCLVL